LLRYRVALNRLSDCRLVFERTLRIAREVPYTGIVFCDDGAEFDSRQLIGTVRAVYIAEAIGGVFLLASTARNRSRRQSFIAAAVHCCAENIRQWRLFI